MESVSEGILSFVPKLTSVTLYRGGVFKITGNSTNGLRYGYSPVYNALVQRLLQEQGL